MPGHGSYFVSIPAYCKLVYWDGVAYYYADDVYYEWSGSAGAYEQVQPPTGLAEKIDAQAPPGLNSSYFPMGIRPTSNWSVIAGSVAGGQTGKWD